LEPGNPAYNIPVAFFLEGELDRGALGGAFAEVVRRHESLRTVFVAHQGEARQVVREAVESRLPVIDLSGLRRELQEEEGASLQAEELAQELAEQAALRPFDLGEGPLLRAFLLDLGEGQEGRRHGMVLTLHHIVSDAWSMGILVEEVSALYRSQELGEGSPLPELAIQYPDFAAWQRRWLESGELDQQLVYWRRQLEGAPTNLSVPTDRPRPPVLSNEGGHATAQLSADLMRSLDLLAQRQGGTLFMVLLAAMGRLLGRWSGQKDVVLGTPIAGRSLLEVEPLIGFFVNTLVLRLAGDSASSFSGLIHQAREAALGAFEHQDVPFERLVEHLEVERRLDRSPLFQAMLVLQNAPGEGVNLPGLELRPMAARLETTKFDLTLTVQETDEGLALDLGYNSLLFDATTAVRFLSRFQRFLEAAASAPDVPLDGLQELPPAELHQVVSEWSGGAPLPASATSKGSAEFCLHDLFEAQVQAQAHGDPQRLAAISTGQSLTFDELSRASNRLARRLREVGVRAESRVGLLVERGAAAMVPSSAFSRPVVPTCPSTPGLRKSGFVSCWRIRVAPQ